MKQTFFTLTIVFFLLEFYVYQAFKTVVTNSVARVVYVGINVLIYIVLIYNMFNVKQGEKDHQAIHWASVLFLSFLLPKLFVVVILLMDDVVRLVQFAVNHFNENNSHYPSRRKFLSLIGLGIGGVFSFLFLDGFFFGKYRHKVRSIKLKIKNLPKQFNGYKIIQISDVHSGSFSDLSKLRPAFDLINQQNADLVLFTGDLVNNVSEEFQGMQSFFKSIKAKDGKFSVLGNHDYGDYIQWNSQEEKKNNLSQLIKMQENAGFKVLRNEHIFIEKNGEKLYIIGVENWGLPPFPQHGDLDKATENIPRDAVKILMSHDPTHFDEVVKQHSVDIALTLSGHTHGMQFGLDLKNIKWSPVQYRYKKWADLYESNGKYLYVNRGFGVIGYPGRVGVLPEITLIELIS